MKNKIYPRKEEEIRKIITDLWESGRTLRRLSNEADKISAIAETITRAIKRGNKPVFFGNGGSAADAQHLTAELIGRFEKERRAMPAIALNTNTSTLTALGNDYGFETVFSRQIEALVKPGDVVIAISTSGNSSNVINGAREAKKRGATVIGLTGKGGGKLKALTNICLEIPSERTCRIQEGHITAGHIICSLVEEKLLSKRRYK